jgi:hypothetical protein
LTLNPPPARERADLERILDRFGGARQSDLTGIQNVLYAAYQLKGSEVFQLQSTVERRALLAYQSEIVRRIEAIGCSGAAQLPRGNDRSELVGTVSNGVTGAVENFNNMLKTQVKRVTEANPDASRQEYRAQLDVWSTRRLQIVNKLIVDATRNNAAAYAGEKFILNNALTAATFVYAGRHPNGALLLPKSSAECIERVGAGEVDYAYTQANKVPNHPRCPHKWEVSGNLKVDCKKVWRG